MHQLEQRRAPLLWRRLIGSVLVMVSLSTGWAPPAASGAIATPLRVVGEASQALVGRLKSGDQKAMLAILGDEGKGWFRRREVDDGIAADACVPVRRDAPLGRGSTGPLSS